MHSAYLDLIDSKKITIDPAQAAIINRLSLLHLALAAHSNARQHKFLGVVPTGRKTQPPRGLYIYGDVGRGKSMLMDLFFETVPIKKKRRVHFHAFMLEIHAALHAWRQENKHSGSKESDPIPALAKSIANACHLLCFDELQVTDIADAMILGRLFKELFKRNVVMVATSNRHPDSLYLDGLQREGFLGCIELLKQKLHVVELTARQDYRLNRLKSIQTTYFSPLGPQADRFIHDNFDTMTGNALPEQHSLMVQGRSIDIPYASGSCALFSFKDLCEKPLGAADYGVLCSHFDTILITDIPCLSASRRNEAKRFVILIDTLYEHHTTLICTAEASPENLYPAGDESFEFQRTVSRLMEMQSEEYMHHKENKTPE